MVSADTIRTFQIVNPENNQIVDVEMSILDRLKLLRMEELEKAIRSLNR